MSTVLFKRGNTADMNDTAITDGLLYFNEENHKIYMDNGTERLQYGGDTELIDNPAEATLTNAFSSRGSLDLFAQKTTVVDSKASALSVTQQYIPLGCLAFKEALGTATTVGIGDGTVSGGLIAVNNKANAAQNGVNSLVSQLQVSGVNFYFDYKNGEYGWNSSSARGAGTFHPFKRAARLECWVTDTSFQGGINFHSTSCDWYANVAQGGWYYIGSAISSASDGAWKWARPASCGCEYDSGGNIHVWYNSGNWYGTDQEGSGTVTVWVKNFFAKAYVV